MHSHSGARRSMVAGGLAVLLTACNSTSIKNLPTDAAAALGTFATNAQDAQRAADSLGWGDKVAPTQLSTSPADLAHFKAAVCAPPFFNVAFAAKTVKSFNEDVAELAKAPDDSLGAYIRALNEHHRQLKDIAADAKPPESYAVLRARLIEKCGPLVDRDLRLADSLESAVSPIAAIDAILALAKLVTSSLALVESQARAEVVKAYVLAHEAEVRKALEMLGGKGGLHSALQSTRTYYLRRAYGAYSDLGEMRASSKLTERPQIGTADDYAQFVAKYLKLQGVDASKLLDDKDAGLRPAYEKFIIQIKQPNVDPYAALDNFLGFLKAISDINSNRQDYLKAWKDLEGSGP